MSDTWTVAGHTFSSRLIVGTGKYKDFAENAAAVEALIAARREARAARDFAESDRIRDELNRLGVVVKDNKDGTTSWEAAR